MNSRIRVRAYDGVSPEVTTSSDCRQGCPWSPFLFNFVTDAPMETTLSRWENSGTELLPGGNLPDLEYADDKVLMNKDPREMSLNQSHRAGVESVVLFYGERLLIFYDGCELKLSAPLKGSHTGRVYLTSHRVIFINKNMSSGLQSLSMPFVYMKEVDVKQPVFGANAIVGRISAEPNGGWQGEAEFRMTFKKGGAIEFAQALIDLGRRACTAKQNFRPPPYAQAMDMNGAGQFYSCPPPAYAPPYNDPYYGFIKPHEAFSQPPPSSLYHVGAPPPYPGAAPQADNTWPSAPAYPQAPGYPPPPGSSFGAVGGNMNSSDAPMSAAHAAKAAEAAASASNAVTGGYYFREDPHNVYAPPPPPEDLPPPYPAANSESDQPPAYPGNRAQDKKNQ